MRFGRVSLRRRCWEAVWNARALWEAHDIIPHIDRSQDAHVVPHNRVIWSDSRRYVTAPYSPFNCLQHVALLLANLLQDDISRLLGDHVCRDSGKSTGNLRENGSIDDTQTSSATDPEA